MSTSEVTIKKHTGLHVGNVAGFTDEQFRIYCLGLAHGMRGERYDALRWNTEHSPAERVVDVVVELSDGQKEMTWDEFETWIRVE